MTEREEIKSAIEAVKNKEIKMEDVLKILNRILNILIEKNIC